MIDALKDQLCVWRFNASTLELRFGNSSIPEFKVLVPKSWMPTQIGSKQRVQRPKGKAEQSRVDTSVGRQRLQCSQSLVDGSKTQQESTLEEGPSKANQSDQELVPLGWFSDPNWDRK